MALELICLGKANRPELARFPGVRVSGLSLSDYAAQLVATPWERQWVRSKEPRDFAQHIGRSDTLYWVKTEGNLLMVAECIVHEVKPYKGGSSLSVTLESRQAFELDIASGRVSDAPPVGMRGISYQSLYAPTSLIGKLILREAEAERLARYRPRR